MIAHGTVTIRSGVMFQVSREDYDEIIEKFCGDKNIIAPTSAFYLATNPYNGSSTVIDLNEVVAVELVDREGIRKEMEFREEVKEIGEDIQGPEWKQGGGHSF